jgi:hypothetical protein
MKWTKKVPTKPGWYWAKPSEDNLRSCGGPRIVWMGGTTVECVGDDYEFEPSDFSEWWDEPIPRPLGGDG